MPKDTFLRLPQEKRERILEAAWQEFGQTPFVDVSINRIVHEAQIPRGSFYQYFEDKTDLFRHLLREMYVYMMRGFLDLLRGCGGDLFETSLACYDRLFEMEEQGQAEQLERYFAVLQRNPGVELQQLDWCSPAKLRDTVTRDVARYVDSEKLHCPDQQHCEALLGLCLMSLVAALAPVRAGEVGREEGRAHLKCCLDYLRYGGLRRGGDEKEARS